MMFMGINVAYHVPQTVKIESATYRTEPAIHVSLVGQDNSALYVRINRITKLCYIRSFFSGIFLLKFWAYNLI